jgi:hypothetical protein
MFLNRQVASTPLRTIVKLAAVVACATGILIALIWVRQERVAIRYQPKKRLPVDESYRDTDGVRFRVEADQLFVNNDGDEVVLAIPAKLRESASWRVLRNVKNQLLILVNERGMAVWDSKRPYQQRHVWAAVDEPLAGKATGGKSISGNRRYNLHRLDVAFTIHPEGTVVCIHATKQNSWSHRDSTIGAVLLRDIETGEDIERLVHHDWGQVIDKVAWSLNGTRLATFSSYRQQDAYTIYVWDVVTGKRLAEIDGIVDQFRFSDDESKLFVLSERSPQFFSVYLAENGEKLVSRKLRATDSFSVSPDDNSIAVSGNGRIELLDAKTLKSKWTSNCREPVGRMAFREDSSELAATWFRFGSSAGVKAWNTADGTVVLDDPQLPLAGGLFYREDGALQAGEFVFEPISPEN